MDNVTKTKRYNTVVFCQALADIPFTINIALKSNTLIVAVLPKVFEILKEQVKDKEQILLISYPKAKEFFSFKRKYKTLLDFLLKQEGVKIYFFSLGFDWISLSMIARLSLVKRNEIFLFDHYKNISEKNSISSLNTSLKTIYYTLMVGRFSYHFRKLSKSRNTIVLDKEVYNIKSIDIEYFKHQSNQKLISINNVTKKAVLYVDSGMASKDSEINEEKLHQIMSICENHGIDIYIKKHPNFNFSVPIFSKYPLIPNQSIELLDISNFIAVIGIGSLALLRNNAPNKISVLSLLYSQESEYHSKTMQYLCSQSKKSELKIPKKVAEFESIIKGLI